MIIQIKSHNDHLLDLLFKNPQTDMGLYFKPLKNGIIAGNAVSAHEYEVVFQDTKYSYLPEESNQLDFQSYCSPLAVLHISTELFSHILKEKEVFAQQVLPWLNKTQGSLDTVPCNVIIPTFYIHSSWYRESEFLLSRYFAGIKATHIKGRNFRLELTAESVFQAINLLNLVALFTHMTNEYGLFTFIDDSFAHKYVRILTNIDNIPYFIFYLYSKRAVKSNKQFQLVKPVMEQYLAQNGIKAELTWHGTQHDRLLFVTELLGTETAVLDIGCGEFAYYKKMMNKGLKANYYAVDEEEHLEKLGTVIAARIEADNLFFFKSIDAVQVTEKVNIIMSEVIEHNPLEEARHLIEKVLRFDFNLIVITTPNADFNQYYFKADELRHDDHHFELSQEQFRELILESIGRDQDLNAEFRQIGDTLNGTQPTQACIITRKTS